MALGWSEQASGGILQRCFCCESEADSSPSCGFPVTRTCLSSLSLTLLWLLKEEEPELGSVTYSAARPSLSKGADLLLLSLSASYQLRF